jgi:hypothetical protein
LLQEGDLRQHRVAVCHQFGDLALKIKNLVAQSLMRLLRRFNGGKGGVDLL